MGSVFPEEIFLEILSRLPVKSLMKFKCVSKSWYFLIRDPRLGELHLLHHRSRRLDSLNIALCHRSAPRLRSYKLVGEEITRWEQNMFGMDWVGYGPYGLQIMSCEGLICFVRDEMVHVCNPTTGELERLPRTCSFGPLAFGFGYDPMRKEYKVVRPILCSLVDEIVSRSEVITLGDDGGWRTIEQSVELVRGRPVTLNGVIYWMSKSKLVTFNVGDESFGETKVPSIFKDNLPDGVMLVVLHGKLCLVNNVRHDDGWNGELHIWMLKDRTSGLWTKEYCFEPHRCGMPWDVTPVCMWREKIVLQHKGYRFFFYDLETRTFSEVRGDWDRLPYDLITDYMESLVTVKRGDSKRPSRPPPCGALGRKRKRYEGEQKKKGKEM